MATALVGEVRFHSFRSRSLEGSQHRAFAGTVAALARLLISGSDLEALRNNLARAGRIKQSRSQNCDQRDGR
jgi:hypothetical protein